MRTFSLILGLVLLLGCKSQNKISSDHGPNTPAFTYEKTPCFGTCPVYKLTVNISGEARLVATSNLELKGNYKCADCDDLMMTKVVEKANEIEFWKLQDKYDPGVTDLPSTITSFFIRDSAKSVVNVMEGPEKLKELEQLIEDLYLKRNWVKE